MKKKSRRPNKLGQFSFEDPLFKTELAFGGTLMKKAKFRTFRPLSKKNPLHMSLYSSQAMGPWGFKTIKNFKIVMETLKECAGKYGIKIDQFANNGNHLHLLFRITNRTLYNRFVRAFTGLLAQRITGLGKIKLKKKFWDYRPFTRVVIGRRGYEIARDYVILNKLEAMGVIDYQSERLKTIFRPLLNSS